MAGIMRVPAAVLVGRSSYLQRLRPVIASTGPELGNVNNQWAGLKNDVAQMELMLEQMPAQVRTDCGTGGGYWQLRNHCNKVSKRVFLSGRC